MPYFDVYFKKYEIFFEYQQYKKISEKEDFLKDNLTKLILSVYFLFSRVFILKELITSNEILNSKIESVLNIDFENLLFEDFPF